MTLLAPTLVKPLNVTVPTPGVEFKWVHNSPDASAQTGWVLLTTTGGVTQYWNVTTANWSSSLVTNSGLTNHAFVPTARLTLNTQYSYSIRTTTATETSAYSSDVFTFKAAPVATITAPSGSVGSARPTLSWSYAQTNGNPQEAYRAAVVYETDLPRAWLDTSTNDFYIDDKSGSVTRYSGAFTVIAHIRMDSAPTGDHIIAGMWSSVAGTKSWALYISDTGGGIYKLKFKVSSDGTTEDVNVNSVSAVAYADQWVKITYNPAAGQVSFFADSKYLDMATAGANVSVGGAFTPFATTGNDMGIGCDSVKANNFPGYIAYFEFRKGQETTQDREGAVINLARDVGPAAITPINFTDANGEDFKSTGAPAWAPSGANKYDLESYAWTTYVWQQDWTLGTAGSVVVGTDLTSALDYAAVVQVRALNGNYSLVKQSAFVRSFASGGAPVTIVTAVAGGKANINLNPPTGTNRFYVVERSVDGGTTWAELPGATRTSPTEGSLITGEENYLDVSPPLNVAVKYRAYTYVPLGGGLYDLIGPGTVQTITLYYAGWVLSATVGGVEKRLAVKQAELEVERGGGVVGTPIVVEGRTKPVVVFAATGLWDTFNLVFWTMDETEFALANEILVAKQTITVQSVHGMNWKVRLTGPVKFKNVKAQAPIGTLYPTRHLYAFEAPVTEVAV